MESMEADEQPFSPVTNQASVATKISSATLVGLLISLFAMVVIRYAFAFFVPEITFASAILKETLIWASAAALLVIIRRGERLSLRVNRPRHISLVEIDCLGIGDRDRIGGSRWRPGLSHRVRTRSGVRCIREAAALVDYTDRFARWSGGRIILPRLRH
jgi:hypothetical protein